MSKYYVAPPRYSGENPIADALGGASESIARGLMLRQQMQAQRENDAIDAARTAERDQLSMLQGGWQEGAAPEVVDHRQMEPLPGLPQSPFQEPPEDPVGAALRSRMAPEAPQLPDPGMMMPTFQPDPDYMQATAGGKEFHKPTPSAVQKQKDREALQKRQRELALKATELGVATPDWSSTDPDEFEMTLAEARRRDALGRRATSVGHRAPNPGEDLNTFQAAVESAEARNAQSIQTNRFADDARMNRREEVDARIGRLASSVMHITDPAAASRAVARMLTSKDHRLGITPIDVLQRARISGGSSRGEADPKAEARKVWEKLAAPIKIGSTGASRAPSSAKVLAEWEKMKPELAVMHGESFVSQMDALIRQLAAARESTSAPSR